MTTADLMMAYFPAVGAGAQLADAFTSYCAKLRTGPDEKRKYAIIQGEDEIASIGIVIGAGWNGARAFTATSGPGISLMQEFFGLGYFAEIPAVIFDVQRAGPSTGMPTRNQQSDVIATAYASHGDTKHVVLFPENPGETFEFAAQAFDLADRLQTPVFVLLDLEIGMNQHLCAPFKWDDARKYDRGKVMTAAELDAGRDFGRYLDVDGDGIAFRTLPGVHPTKGAYFTRGTSRDRYARYTEDGAAYVDNMQRLLRKFETAKGLVPRPVRRNAEKPTKYGVIYYGSTAPAMDEAIAMLEGRGNRLDMLRVRAFPFHQDVTEFIIEHDFVFVVEQNRDSQMRTLIMNECGIDPVRLVPILHYDGTPITARFIAGAIGEHLDAFKVTPLRVARHSDQGLARRRRNFGARLLPPARRGSSPACGGGLGRGPRPRPKRKPRRPPLRQTAAPPSPTLPAKREREKGRGTGLKDAAVPYGTFTASGLPLSTMCTVRSLSGLSPTTL